MDFAASSNPTAGYAASSDLSRLCLPQEYKDSNRRLAWVNSVCCLFLLIATVGLRPPPVHLRELTEITEIVPIVITPEEEPPPPPKPTDEPPPPETTTELAPDIPVVATVVAANSSAVAFAVPVEGPVVLAPARLAAPPPPKETLVRPPAPKAPTKYVPSASDWGGQPTIPYPAAAIRLGAQGTNTFLVVVDPEGRVVNLTLKKGAGHFSLDEAARNHIRKNLRLNPPPGETREILVDHEFSLNQ